MAQPKPSFGGRIFDRLASAVGAAGHGPMRPAIEDPSAAIVFGNRIIFLGVALFFAWAALAPLDEGVPASGVVSVESMRKMVSHFGGGIVSAVHVRENQPVRAGDPLITLDSTKAQAAYDAAVHEYIAASAKLARLNAERVWSDSIHFGDELLLYAGQMGRQDYLTSQEQLFQVRRQSFQSEQAILRENLSASHGQVAGVQGQLEARSLEASIMKEDIEKLRPLADIGYTSRSNLHTQERQLAELTSVTRDLQTRISKESSTSAELRLRLLQRRQEFLKDVETQVADTEREVSNLRARLSDARKDLEQTVIRAPISGQVMELQVQTPGAAVTPGSRICDLIPADDRLLVDVQVPTNLINRVTPGLPTHVQISTFADTPSLVLDGVVQSVSADEHKPPNAPPYYLARIEITPQGLAELHGKQLRPGMPVTAVIKTGERTLLAYLLRPLTKRVFTALQEP